MVLKAFRIDEGEDELRGFNRTLVVLKCARRAGGYFAGLCFNRTLVVPRL